MHSLDITGTIATWYFNPGSEVATLPALKRATTTSFGSACLGALIIATIETLEMIASYAKNSLARDSEANCLTMSGERGGGGADGLCTDSRAF